jgi:predicted transcriptional regulator
MQALDGALGHQRHASLGAGLHERRYERITAILASADQPIPFAELRSQVRVRAATLLERIGALCADGRIVKTNGGYRLAST